MSADHLLDIYRQAAEMAAQDAQRPQSCPNDGTPYKTGPNGELYCPFDGYRPIRSITNN